MDSNAENMSTLHYVCFFLSLYPNINTATLFSSGYPIRQGAQQTPLSPLGHVFNVFIFLLLWCRRKNTVYSV